MMLVELDGLVHAAIQTRRKEGRSGIKGTKLKSGWSGGKDKPNLSR